MALARPDKLGELYSQHAVHSEHGTGFSAENWCVMPKLGNHLYLAIDAGPIHDEAGNLIAVVETLRDMTDQKRAEMALKTLAAKDGLTGLANRRAFDQALDSEWLRAQRSRKPLSLLFVDVDHFKLFNDKHGHQSGDECLRAVAAIVGAQALRPTDLAARYGGEEFAIILPETDGDGAMRGRRAHPESGDRTADRPWRGARRRPRHAQRRRRNAGAEPRHRAGLPARAGRPGALCRQTPRPQPRDLGRHHAGRDCPAQWRQIGRIAPATQRDALTATSAGALQRLY